MTTQAEELARVFDKVAGSIMRFRKNNPSDIFHVEDLRQFVLTEHATIAPDSPGRILRDMRQHGMINYVVLNRRNSLYQFQPLPQEVKHVNDISPPTTNVEQVVAAYVQLRDWIAEQKRLYEERVEPRKAQLEQLNSILLRYLNETNQTAARTEAGTAYKKVWTSATVRDKEAFRRHVIGSEAWDLIDWRANKTAVTEAVETYGDPPPGINFSRGYDVGVRRPGKDD
jgi:hypothetical protein